MELNNIEKLVEKYFDATTTVAEEELLREYFNQESVAPHLEKYVPMFQYFTKAKSERFTKEVSLPKKNVSNKKQLYGWLSVAAAVAICIGLYFNEPKPADTFTPQELASAQAALALLGDNFTKGTQQINYLNEFERNTNKFLKH